MVSELARSVSVARDGPLRQPVQPAWPLGLREPLLMASPELQAQRPLPGRKHRPSELVWRLFPIEPTRKMSLLPHPVWQADPP